MGAQLKKVITEIDIVNLYRSGSSTITIDANSLITPAAKDKINDLKIKIINPESESKKENTEFKQPYKELKKVE